jgi:hypothetical protein
MHWFLGELYLRLAIVSVKVMHRKLTWRLCRTRLTSALARTSWDRSMEFGAGEEHLISQVAHSNSIYSVNVSATDSVA